MTLRRQLIAVLLTLITGCSQPGIEPAQPPSPTARPADFPAAFYADAAARGQSVLQIDSSHSLVSITVRRAGALARLGHDHVIASHELQGYVAPRLGRADLYVALDRLSVDEPALRAKAALDTQPSAADIEATRANMLNKLLQTSLHPFALIQAHASPEADGDVLLALELTLHGVTRSLSVPARIRRTPSEFHISGSLNIDQSSFGITPLSILGGAIQVRDRLELNFEVRAAPPLKQESLS
ncbi:YceI family protein [Comamonas thiooxydans]|uniref:YceI family protein n=1 Tax=Comamonas thiooxydans TaxID=363952 RepID=UPI00050F2E5D|nr:YceI family protein [Comamonas thiooxydans]KGG81842.1 polyisoprenoid-binding protein [Comamonas thiooxydans]